MRQVKLGGLTVSDWSLGTMTFGTQTPEADAHRQMDLAHEAGITLWDTAEMYPVNPVRAETAGESEAIVGRWLAANPGKRDGLRIATKITGPGSPVRAQGFDDPAHLRRCCEASLKRLQVESIDLYQLHWPERGTWAFRNNWTYRPEGDRAATLAHMDRVLGALGDLKAEGKIREIGLSNETAWGTTRWIDRAAATGAPRVVSVQNEYSLLHRLSDTDLAEVMVNEDVAMLAFSPLACGVLTGKYRNGAVPPGSRKAIIGDGFTRQGPNEAAATEAYLQLAAEAGLDPVHMALAWHRTRAFTSIPIFGATSVPQLERILAGIDVTLSSDLVTAIDRANRRHPLPF